MAGIFAAECIHRRFKHMEKVHWRQLIILAEIAVLFAVGFMPQSLNTVANSLVSFSCAMQLQTFRKVRGHAYASTMCIGNMRSGTEALCAYFHTHEPEALRNALTYFGVIGLFALGAGLGALLTGASAVRGNLGVLRPADRQLPGHVHSRGAPGLSIRSSYKYPPAHCAGGCLFYSLIYLPLQVLSGLLVENVGHVAAEDHVDLAAHGEVGGGAVGGNNDDHVLALGRHMQVHGGAHHLRTRPRCP